MGDIIHIEFGNSSVSARILEISESCKKEAATKMYEIIRKKDRFGLFCFFLSENIAPVYLVICAKEGELLDHSVEFSGGIRHIFCLDILDRLRHRVVDFVYCLGVKKENRNFLILVPVFVQLFLFCLNSASRTLTAVMISSLMK